MTKTESEKPGDQGISKVKLAIGAASLFLFIIGVKRTFQMDEHRGDAPTTPPPPPRGKKADKAEPGERRGRRKSDRAAGRKTK